MKKSRVIGVIVAALMVVLLYVLTGSGAAYILKQSGDLSSPYISIIRIIGFLVTCVSLFFIFKKKH